jgi:hypothetical protein
MTLNWLGVAPVPPPRLLDRSPVAGDPEAFLKVNSCVGKFATAAVALVAGKARVAVADEVVPVKVFPDAAVALTVNAGMAVPVIGIEMAGAEVGVTTRFPVLAGVAKLTGLKYTLTVQLAPPAKPLKARPDARQVLLVMLGSM